MRSELRLLAGWSLALSLAAGCTDDSGDGDAGHVLEEHQRAVERARGVEDDMAKAAREQRRRIDADEDGR